MDLLTKMNLRMGSDGLIHLVTDNKGKLHSNCFKHMVVHDPIGLQFALTLEPVRFCPFCFGDYDQVHAGNLKVELKRIHTAINGLGEAGILRD